MSKLLDTLLILPYAIRFLPTVRLVLVLFSRILLPDSHRVERLAIGKCIRSHIFLRTYNVMVMVNYYEHYFICLLGSKRPVARHCRLRFTGDGDGGLKLQKQYRHSPPPASPVSDFLYEDNR